MALLLICKCGARLRMKDELAGKRVKCPGCGQVQAVPSPAGVKHAGRIQAQPKPPPRKSGATAAAAAPGGNASPGPAARKPATRPAAATPGRRVSPTAPVARGALPVRWPWFAGAALVVVLLAAGSTTLWLRAHQPPGPAGAALPGDGPGDPALTYDEVARSPATHRGKRVTWTFVPCSAEGKRMMCALDRAQATGPRHYGIYVVEFESEQEAAAAFEAAAFTPGSTVTATVAGAIDQWLVARDAAGVPAQDVPKVTVPLLLHPAYRVAAAGKDPGAGTPSPSTPADRGKGEVAGPQPAGPTSGDKPPPLPGAAGERVDYPSRPPLLWAVFLTDSDKLPKDGPTAPWSQVFPSGTKKLTLGVVFYNEPALAEVSVRVWTNSGELRLAEAEPDFLKINETYIRYLDIAPREGPFADGPYQAEVSINGSKVAVLNWSVGKAPEQPAVARRPGASGERVVELRKPPDSLRLRRYFLTADSKKVPGPKEAWPQVLPSGTREVWVGLGLDQKPPDGTNLTVFILDADGFVKMPQKFEPVTINSAGEFIWLLPCSPGRGAFPDGPYQAQIYIDGIRCALLNWSVGSDAGPKAEKGPPAEGGDQSPSREVPKGQEEKLRTAIRRCGIYGGTVTSDDLAVTEVAFDEINKDRDDLGKSFPLAARAVARKNPKGWFSVRVFPNKSFSLAELRELLGKEDLTEKGSLQIPMQFGGTQDLPLTWHVYAWCGFGVDAGGKVIALKADCKALPAGN
jgi:hypothetical protein